MFYSGQSGRPWSANYDGDYNGDVARDERPALHPGERDEVTFTNGTFDDLMTFVNAEQCLADFIGKIHERNACRAPWIEHVRLARSTSACRSSA